LYNISAKEVAIGDLNNDKIPDTLIYSNPDTNNQISIVIKLANNQDVSTKRSFQYTLSEQYGYIKIIDNGCIRIFQSGTTGGSNKYYSFYKYNNKFNNWYCTKKIYYAQGVGIEMPHIEITYPDGTDGVDGSKINSSQAKTISKDEREKYYQNKLTQMHAKLMVLYRNKKTSSIPQEFFEVILLAELKKNVPVTIENVEQYNNIAFIIGLSNDGYYSSAYLLKYIISVIPSRTVAYLNLGDAYSGMQDSSEAKRMYLQYITLMRKDGKESKIPKRVKDFVQNN
jgi:hypothetical protein